MKLELDLDESIKSPHYAGFGIRFAAFAIDSAVLLVLVSLPLYLFFGWEQLRFLWQTPAGELVDQYIALLYDPEAARRFLDEVSRLTRSMLVHHLILLVIYVVCWVRFLGTPGKLWLGLEIVDERSLAPLSVQASVIRFLGYFVSSFMFGLGFIWVAVDKRHQGFHDMMARSVVIYRN